jgi:aromatic-L-amino-acid decarboxylase
MLWRTSPAGTELEEVVCDWLRQMLGLPEVFNGHINDTASMSTFLALAAARSQCQDLDVRNRGLSGRPDLPALTVYASQEAHSSVGKTMLALGLGLDNLRQITTDPALRMDPVALIQAIETDRKAGFLPIAVVATLGTTSSTSIDPVDRIADICQDFSLWLHVDAAWAGSAAICPEYRQLMQGMERADSIVVNPHKWLFTPIDCSLLFLRDTQAFRQAFSLVPDYLQTDQAGAERDLMGLGVQLGKRFRALKLWMVIRTFGVEGLRQRIREHCRLGQELGRKIAAEPGFEVVAPIPFSTVCFRQVFAASATEIDRRNERLLAAVNSEGPVFLSHTRLRGRYVLRLAVSNLRTKAEHVDQAWMLIRRHAKILDQEAQR